jgi:hypothetical protein
MGIEAYTSLESGGSTPNPPDKSMKSTRDMPRRFIPKNGQRYWCVYTRKLDMYLEKKTYVKSWEHDPKGKKYKVTVKRGGKDTGVLPDRVKYVIEEIGYWRKANAIHKWFVDNVQGGNDDCAEYLVSRKELQELLKLAKQALSAKTQEEKEELLPAQEGFFFGDTDCGEDYEEDLKTTVDILEKALKEPNDEGEFIYSSSW